MKHSVFFILAIIFMATSCTNTGKNQGTEQKQDSVRVVPQSAKSDKSSPHPLMKIFVNYTKNNPNAFNNSATRDNAATKIQSILFDSIQNNPSLLKTIPFRYEDLMKKGNKYIVKFSLSSFSEKNINYRNNDKYSISFDVFTIADDSFVEVLKDRYFYKFKNFDFKGSVNGKIALPSGRTFSQNSFVLVEKDYNSKYDLNIGGIYLTNVELESWK